MLPQLYHKTMFGKHSRILTTLSGSYTITPFSGVRYGYIYKNGSFVSPLQQAYNKKSKNSMLVKSISETNSSPVSSEPTGNNSIDSNQGSEPQSPSGDQIGENENSGLGSLTKQVDPKSLIDNSGSSLSKGDSDKAGDNVNIGSKKEKGSGTADSSVGKTPSEKLEIEKFNSYLDLKIGTRKISDEETIAHNEFVSYQDFFSVTGKSINGLNDSSTQSFLPTKLNVKRKMYLTGKWQVGITTTSNFGFPVKHNNPNYSRTLTGVNAFENKTPQLKTNVAQYQLTTGVTSFGKLLTDRPKNRKVTQFVYDVLEGICILKLSRGLTSYKLKYLDQKMKSGIVIKELPKSEEGVNSLVTSTLDSSSKTFFAIGTGLKGAVHSAIFASYIGLPFYLENNNQQLLNGYGLNQVNFNKPVTIITDNVDVVTQMVDYFDTNNFGEKHFKDVVDNLADYYGFEIFTEMLEEYTSTFSLRFSSQKQFVPFSTSYEIPVGIGLIRLDPENKILNSYFDAVNTKQFFWDLLFLGEALIELFVHDTMHSLSRAVRYEDTATGAPLFNYLSQIIRNQTTKIMNSNYLTQLLISIGLKNNYLSTVTLYQKQFINLLNNIQLVKKSNKMPYLYIPNFFFSLFVPLSDINNNLVTNSFSSMLRSEDVVNITEHNNYLYTSSQSTVGLLSLSYIIKGLMDYRGTIETFEYPLNPIITDATILPSNKLAKSLINKQIKIQVNYDYTEIEGECKEEERFYIPTSQTNSQRKQVTGNEKQIEMLQFDTKDTSSSNLSVDLGNQNVGFVRGGARLADLSNYGYLTRKKYKNKNLQVTRATNHDVNYPATYTDYSIANYKGWTLKDFLFYKRYIESKLNKVKNNGSKKVSATGNFNEIDFGDNKLEERLPVEIKVSLHIMANLGNNENLLTSYSRLFTNELPDFLEEWCSVKISSEHKKLLWNIQYCSQEKQYSVIKDIINSSEIDCCIVNCTNGLINNVSGKLNFSKPVFIICGDYRYVYVNCNLEENGLEKYSTY